MDLDSIDRLVELCIVGLVCSCQYGDGFRCRNARLTLCRLIGDGLEDWSEIGIGLANWHWIDNRPVVRVVLGMDLHLIDIGLAMDWHRIVIRLAYLLWIGPAEVASGL